MRPSGGYTPEMYNYSQETDVYKIWADMVAFDCNTKPIGAHHFCAFYGRRDGRRYKLDDYEVMMKYGSKMVMWDASPTPSPAPWRTRCTWPISTPKKK